MRYILYVLMALAVAMPAHAFEFSSPDLKGKKIIPDQFVFNGFGCSGQNQSPALTWKDAPKDTKSFAILVHDPDAPTGGSGWWHWLAYNIPVSTTSLPTNAGVENSTVLPAGTVQSITDFSKAGWGGPCSPVGRKHRYVFTIYALKVDKLDLPATSMPALVGFMVNQNAIAKASFTAHFSRNK